jgi:hypothetical protein
MKSTKKYSLSISFLVRNTIIINRIIKNQKIKKGIILSFHLKKINFKNKK